MGTDELMSFILEAKRFNATQWQPFLVRQSKRRKPMDWRQTAFRKEIRKWCKALSTEDAQLFGKAADKLLDMTLQEMKEFVPNLSLRKGWEQFEQNFGNEIPEHLKEWLIKEAESLLNEKIDCEQRDAQVMQFVEALTEEEREDLECALYQRSKQA